MFSVSLVGAYTVDGDTAYIDTSGAYVGVTPHTVVGTSWVTVEWESKLADVNVTVLFGYNGEYLEADRLQVYSPQYEVINGTNTSLREWQDIGAGYLNKISHEFDGKNTWFYRTSIPLEQGERYKARVRIRAPLLPLGETDVQKWYPGYDGKYGIAFFPSSYGTDIQAAISNGHFYYLDPVVNLTDGLQHYYKLDNDTVDEEGNINGTASNVVADSVNRFRGSHSYFYDGVANEHVSLSGTTLKDQAAFTINMWVNLTGESGETDTVFAMNESGSFSQLFGYYDAGVVEDSLKCILDGGISGSSDDWDVESSTGIPVNEWTMVTCVFAENGDAKVYINGVLNGTDSTSHGTFSSGMGTTFDIGGRSDGNRDAVSGNIDEVGIWHTNLSDEEILGLYNAGIGCAWEELATCGAPADEEGGRAAIVSGLDNSGIGGSYMSYTDRQVHVRLANGTQYQGTFDVFASAGNKRWAFNYDNESTSGFPTFVNVTPAFWVWQRAGLSGVEISSDVRAFVDSTN